MPIKPYIIDNADGKIYWWEQFFALQKDGFQMMRSVMPLLAMKQMWDAAEEALECSQKETGRFLCGLYEDSSQPLKKAA